MSFLIVMCGLSGSGKSTIAKNLQKQLKCEVIATDDIREELGDVNDQTQNSKVFHIFYERIKEALRKGKTVVADATFLTLKDRHRLLREVDEVERSCGHVTKAIIVVGRKIESCLELNAARDRIVPEEVIYRQRAKFQIPFEEEGWDRVHILTNGDKDYATLVLEMNNFNQKTPHHKYDLLTHSIFVWSDFNKQDGAIFHDYGKLFTQTFDNDGVAHYYNHENVGAYEIMTNYDNGADLNLLFLINYHMMPFGWNSDKARNKWRRIFGKEKYEMLVRFNECDIRRGKK